LLLLFAFSVATLTATVMVAPVGAASGSGSPTTNGDPDRPNDAPKPTVQPQNTAQPSMCVQGRGTIRGAQGVRETLDALGWSQAMNHIATLLGRRGL
jgi:hypothetical protein